MELNLCDRSRRWALKHIPDPHNGEIRVWGDGGVGLLGCAPSVSSDLRGAALRCARLASPRLASLPFSIRTSLDASLHLASTKGWGEEGQGAASHAGGEATETGKSKSKEREGMEMTDANTKSRFQRDSSSDSVFRYSLHDARSRLINWLMRYYLNAQLFHLINVQSK